MNVFFVQPPANLDVGDLVDYLQRNGVLVASPYAGRTLRLVTHYGIEAADVERALEVFARATQRTTVAA